MKSETIKFRINGTSPLLMHSPQGANPLHPINLEKKKITSKSAKSKTEDDLVRLMDLEYQINMYYDDEIGPYIPAEMLEAAICGGAKKTRNGKLVKAGVIVDEDRIPLEYQGSRKMDDLIKNMGYRDVRFVNVQRAKILRCRPRFNHWGLEFGVRYFPEVIDRQTVIDSLITAGQFCAIGDNRPRNGQFNVEVM